MRAGRGTRWYLWFGLGGSWQLDHGGLVPPGRRPRGLPNSDRREDGGMRRLRAELVLILVAIGLLLSGGYLLRDNFLRTAWAVDKSEKLTSERNAAGLLEVPFYLQNV